MCAITGESELFKIIMLSYRSQTKRRTEIQCVSIILYNSRKCKLIYCDRKQISGCLAMGWKSGNGMRKGAGRRDYIYTYRLRVVLVSIFIHVYNLS